MYFIAGKDYGLQVVKSFERFYAINKGFYIQMPNAYDADTAARLFVAKYVKEKLGIAKLPFWIVQLLANFSTPFNYAAHIITAMNNYPEQFQAQQTWQEPGKPSITLEQFAKSC